MPFQFHNESSSVLQNKRERESQRDFNDADDDRKLLWSVQDNNKNYTTWLVYIDGNMMMNGGRW